MKAIHRSEYRDARGGVSIYNRIRATLRRGSLWQREMAGEDRVAAVLGRLLDDSYTLIRNVVLPGDPYDLDMILVGPPGIWEFEILHFVGLVTTDAGWMHWDYNQGGLRPIPRELGPRTQGKVARLNNFLAQHGLSGLDVNQAIILSTPNAPREFTIPQLQIVFIDELERFIQTALTLLRPATPVPVGQVVEQLRGVAGGEAAADAQARIWGMTRTQFFILLAIAFGDACILTGLCGALLYYRF